MFFKNNWLIILLLAFMAILTDGSIVSMVRSGEQVIESERAFLELLDSESSGVR